MTGTSPRTLARTFARRFARGFARTSMALVACVVLTAPGALAQDPAEAARALLVGREAPPEHLVGEHLLGAYKGLVWVGQAELDVREDRGKVRVDMRSTIELGGADREDAELVAVFEPDFTIDEYRRTRSRFGDDIVRLVESIVPGRGRYDGLHRRTVSGERERDGAEIEIVPGRVPAGLGWVLALLVHREPPESVFRFEVFDARGKITTAELLVVGRRSVAIAGDSVDSFQVRLERTHADDGGGEAKTVTDIHVGTDGRLLQISTPASPIRFLLCDPSKMGQDLAVDTSGDFDQLGRDPKTALLVLFEAMGEEADEAIDALVDYQEFYVRYYRETPPSASGAPAGGGAIPVEILRRQWEGRSDSLINQIRGRWFSRQWLPYGDASTWTDRLTFEREGDEAAIVLAGRAERTWVMSRESGRWRVVHYREKE